MTERDRATELAVGRVPPLIVCHPPCTGKYSTFVAFSICICIAMHRGIPCFPSKDPRTKIKDIQDRGCVPLGIGQEQLLSDRCRGAL